MIEVDVGKKKLKGKCTVHTLMIYEQEFDGRDMIKDLFGKVRQPDSDDNLVMDYTNTNWTATLRALWAMLKTQNADTPSFEKWENDFSDEIDLFTIANDVLMEVFDTCFRNAATQVKG